MTDSAAIGLWARKNRQYWRIWKGKLYIKYARPSLSTSEFLQAMEAQGRERQSNLEVLTNYKVTEQATISETKDGVKMRGALEIILTRRGMEDATPVPITTLRGREREAANSLLKVNKRLFSATPPTKATWCSLICDLGLDLLTLRGTGEYVSADTISSVLDAPPMHIRMSDLIHFGLLLEMKLVEVDELKRILNMTGRYCSLVSKHQDGVGMLCRYAAMSLGTQPAVKRTSGQEAQMLCESADGMIYIGDCMMLITSFGFNSVDAIMKHVLRHCQGNKWQEISLKAFLRNAEADGQLAYEGKWSNPPTPITGLLMAMCGNIGVGNAFPHETIHNWTPEMISVATREAFQAAQSQPGVVVAPRDIFQRIWDAGTDIMIMDEFKAVNNYGCQFGGIRGWLSTNMAAFTLKMSQVWTCERENRHGFQPVPILSQLLPVLRAGALSQSWGEDYNFNQEKGNGWRLPATALLWLQISLLDTWLARHVDVMVQESAMPELSVPATLQAAELCAQSANSVLNQSTGWNPPRLRFCRMYLARLANGVGQMGSSFMSTAQTFEDRRMGWKEMPIGTEEEWVMVDAVLTLRAACQHTRLMLMMDSSPLLRLRKFDPVLLLA
ncbi:hypothetical protein FRC20_011317 [Serendipita sp. 405]|nr:hypothetical protein FRC20_011317 [Serendipita sp. 405]